MKEIIGTIRHRSNGGSNFKPFIYKVLEVMGEHPDRGIMLHCECIELVPPYDHFLLGILYSRIIQDPIVDQPKHEFEY